MKFRVFLLVLLSPLCLIAQAWKPIEGKGEVETSNVRIARMGLDNSRNGDGNAHGIAAFNRFKIVPETETGIWRVVSSGKDRLHLHDFDVDGDGNAERDVVTCHPFDMSESNPLTPNAPFYDTSNGTQRFYGGATIYHANYKESTFTEDGINGGEEGPNNQPRRNWTYFHETYQIDSPFRMYFLALWQKFDFLNGGNKYPVSFDENSELRHLVMRYYMGIEGFRWVVRNGEEFFISEKIYEGAGEKLGDKGGKIHSIFPAREKWAVYKPTAPYKIDFLEAKTAQYEVRKFDNVTAVGWLMYKDTLVAGYVGYKWYAFEADAVVSRPARPSESIEMKPLPNNENTWMSACEVPYSLWRQVHRLARSNTFAGPRGFGFRSLGAMGSMGFAKDGKYLEHGQDEPVTEVTLYDALLWCNALSVQESKRPCYYTDAEFKEPFREIVKNKALWPEQPIPTIFVDWTAGGYRLPTPSEWVAGFDDEKATQATGTAAVGTTPANKNGFFDMGGNAAEYVWDYGDSLAPDFDSLTVMGGDFRSSLTATASPYGDRLHDYGTPYISFRILRSAAHGRKEQPLQHLPSAGAATRADGATSFAGSLVTKIARSVATQALSQPTAPAIELVTTNNALQVGKFEVTYQQWKPVWDWAVANGYTFDCTGDMGSMAYWGWGKDWQPSSHSPDEPVTNITQYDAVVWCNALSAMHGLKPAYYADSDLTVPFKNSYIFRPPQLLLGEIAAISSAYKDKTGQPLNTHTGAFPDIFPSPDADGYRMFSEDEFHEFVQTGKPCPWGEEAAILELGWVADNSGLRTHTGGKKKPQADGIFDLFGNVAELAGDTAFNEGNGYVGRLGGSFLDASHGMLQSMLPEHGRGVPYPDTGFRVIRKKAQ